jgi:ABC-type transporter Mla subunit MlaD
MDFKKIVDKVKDAAEDLKEKAEAKITEAREALDKNHDNIPDALEGLTEKAKTLAGQVQEKAKALAEQAEEKAKEVVGMAKEKFEQATSKGAADEGPKKS